MGARDVLPFSAVFPGCVIDFSEGGGERLQASGDGMPVAAHRKGISRAGTPRRVLARGVRVPVSRMFAYCRLRAFFRASES